MSPTTAELIWALAAGLPEGCLVTDPDVVGSYSTDRAMFCLPGRAVALVRPLETAHVQHVMRVASRLQVPVVPQGARSGLSGAAVAIDGCILLNLERMNRVLEIDAANRIVVTQPGIFNAALSRAVAEHGLFYPPDPSSWEFCSIGGNISTNSGGLCCVKYGVTTDYVLGLEVVLADGQVLRTGRRTVKGVAGYDLTKLFVGSEGTLGVVTEITLLLRPATHEPRTVAAVFSSAQSACRAISAVVAAGLVPSLLEFMDRVSVQAVNDAFHLDISPDAGALVLAQSDAGAERADAEISRMAGIFADAEAFEVAVAADAAEGELLLAGRREVLTAFERLGTTMIDDVCVPRSRLADLVERIEKVSESVGLTIGVVGHAGDGNFHPTVVFDGQDPEQVARAKRAFDEIMEISLELGGTITGEHGVGMLKMSLLERELGELSLDVHRRIKHALDPQGIFNPGKVFAS
ncbi:MAG TPA: FAD-linked oxidase C-terminal domain-containing protein [Nocardioidaceae bacterium]|nr:FAD-linked oxidase C-terminal domain-containing protein [Nocardioidaceae bacterium]